MEYKKAYKEALRVIESLYNVVKYQSSPDALLTLQTIEKAFPELKESEDERIRKEIIEFIRTLPCTIHVKEEYFHWLEKQGEQKPVKSEQNCYHNDGLYYAIDILEKTFGKVEGYQSDDGIIEHQTAIETVNALYHKKPAWSEEDIMMSGEIINVLQKTGNYEKEITWFKSIKDRVQPQPKQEWSEADEEKFRDVIRLVEQGAPVQSIRDHYINWLKSFKPQSHWKPSDVQLSCLEDAIDEFSEIDSREITSRHLQSLYNDLKKL